MTPDVRRYPRNDGLGVGKGSRLGWRWWFRHRFGYIDWPLSACLIAVYLMGFLLGYWSHP